MDNYYVEPTVLNTDDLSQPKVGNSLYESRTNGFKNLLPKGEYLVSIVVVGYNRLEKTKNCVKYLLEHTKDVDYELILADNGSSDETLAFYQSVPVANKQIISVTKNIGVTYLSTYFIRNLTSKYLVFLPNDAVVTKNWLSNLLTCMESDPTIATVVPASSNISNLQNPGLTFSSIEEMQAKAAQFNISNPAKWEERLRLITPVTIYRNDLLMLLGCNDVGFFHDYGEDDMSMRFRRAGYKQILCKDTYIHHDHVFSSAADRDPKEYQKSLAMGRENFKEKYYGIDVYDIVNFEWELIAMLPPPKQKDITKILGIDVRCGTPILDIRNFLRRNHITKTLSIAFTTQAKYYLDLQTVVGADSVFCDRMDFIADHIVSNSYDYILLGEPINQYSQPIRLLQRMTEFLKPGGHLLFKLANAYDVRTFLAEFGIEVGASRDIAAILTPQEVEKCLNLMGHFEVQVSANGHNIDSEFEETLKNAIVQTQLTDNVEGMMNRLRTEEYLFCVEKR